MQHVSEALAGILCPYGRTAVPTADRSAEEKLSRQESAEIAAGRLFGCRTRQLRFVNRETTPSPDQDLTVDSYEDDQGNEFWIDPQAGIVLQMGPTSGRYTPTFAPGKGPALAVHELRQLAIEIVERQLPNFSLLLPVFHPLEANDRRRVYFFRWEDLNDPLPESEVPPFVQVGLYADGRLASFADTLGGVRDLPGPKSPILDLPESWNKFRPGE